jgi:hypothetical protein
VSTSERFDLFICHASEDKAAVVRPLARELAGRGLKVWLDELELTIGDTLNGRIEAALTLSRFGVVVISPAFFAKQWPQRELAGLAAREVHAGLKVILPVWHEVDHAYIVERSPVLADRLGALTSEGVAAVADKIVLALERSDSSSATQPRAPVASANNDEGKRGRRWLGWSGLTLVLAAVVGFVAVPGATVPGRSMPLPNSAANQAVEVSLPASWQRSLSSSELPDLKLAQVLPLESSLTAGELIIGTASSGGASLLPTDLLGALPQPPRGEAVQLSAVSAYRYRGLRPEGTALVETIYAAPTTAGVLLGVCPLPARSSPESEVVCEHIMASLKLLSARFLPLGPQLAYTRELQTAITGLNRVSKQVGSVLKHTKTANALAMAAEQLANVRDQAIGDLQSVTPGPVESIANAAIVSALGGASRAYREMARAAGIGDVRAYEHGREIVKIQSARLTQAVASMRSLGYRISGN